MSMERWESLYSSKPAVAAHVAVKLLRRINPDQPLGPPRKLTLEEAQQLTDEDFDV